MAANFSYVSGTSTVPLLYRSVGGVLEDTAACHPGQTALIVRHQSIRWTYRELNERVTAVARGLMALGLKGGDRVAIWSPNNAEWVLTQFAAARAGLILVNINPAYRITELEYAVRKVGCRALILAPAFKSSNYLGIVCEMIPSVAATRGGRIRSSVFPLLEFLIQLGEEDVPGFMRFSSLTDLAPQTSLEKINAIAARIDPDDPINIQFTSGTTGSPKGATLSHFNIVNNAYFTGEGIHLSTADRLCIPVPLYHCFGMVMGVLAAVTHGTTMVFPSEAFDAAAALSAIAAEKCTALYGVPTMFIAELDHPRFREFDLSSLRTGIMAGAPCPIEVMKRVISDMHMREVTICYGMTETSPVSFQSHVDDPLEKRVGTVGRVHPHVQVKIIGPDGMAVPRGIKGELLTRGYSVMRGYWDDAARTAEAIDTAGWMHTGDLATLDDEGYCNIVGRVKDMIIRGGENIYPREIEEYLYRHPKVLDVTVVGIADPKYGEEVCAVIRLHAGETCADHEIIEFCRGQIAHYKVPRYVRFVNEFPMTVTGKVQKFLIRDQLQREMNLRAEATA